MLCIFLIHNIGFCIILMYKIIYDITRQTLFEITFLMPGQDVFLLANPSTLFEEIFYVKGNLMTY